MARVVEVVDEKREEYRHEKCGATVVLQPGDTRAGAGENCPVCEEILSDWRKFRIQRATVGTPIAEEIGQVFSKGEVGPVVP